MRLNQGFMTRRRRELGMSIRALARDAGLSPTRVQAVLDGQHHQYLTLQDVQRLGDALATSPIDLIAQTNTVPDRTENDDKVADLIAVLITVEGGIAKSALAGLLSIDQPALEDLLTTAGPDLRRVGLAVRQHTNDGSIRLVADSARLSDDQVAAAIRAAASRLQLDVGTARLVHGILSGRLTSRDVASSNGGRVKLGQLINAGLVEKPACANGALQLSQDVRESLLLDE